MYYFSILNVFLLSAIFLSNSIYSKENDKDNDVDADMHRDTPEIIMSRGFEYEEHEVVTQDGYILKIFRIVNPSLSSLSSAFKHQQPVLLQHGGFGTSSVYLVNTPGELRPDGVYVEDGGRLINTCNTETNTTGNAQTLGFVLASCGFDVWLGNFRGNSYSDRHESLKNTDPKYWNYTFYEHGVYDISSMIEYIANVTGFEKVSYVGHSLGGMAMFYLLAEKPDFVDRLNVFVGISPPTFAVEVKPTTKSVIYWLGYLINLSSSLNFKSPGTFNFLCNSFIGNRLCHFIAHLDFTFLQFTNTEDRVKSCLVHTLDRMASKAVHHGGQFLFGKNGARLQHYDYGCDGNKIEYGQCEPPLVDWNKIKFKKIALMYGKGDQWATPGDAEHWKKNVKVPLWREFLAPDSWGHYDYIYNYEAGRWSIPWILRVLNEARETRTKDYCSKDKNDNPICKST